MSASTAGGGPPDRRLLGIYLNDHLAGATAGTRLVRRARDGTRDPELRGVLADLASQIDDDKATLVGLMRQLGLPRRVYKVMGGAAAELVGRLKPNGRLRERSPLTDLVEVDGLVMGIRGKQTLWRNLLEVADGLGSMTANDLEALIARADAQLGRLEGVRPRLARDGLLR